VDAPAALEQVRGGWVDGLARAGLVARGVVYLIVGMIVLRLAFGSHEESADARGAIATLVEQPFGKILVGLLAAGLACYTAACALGAVRGYGGKRAGGSDAKGRLADAGRAVVNGALTVAAVAVLAGSGSGGGGNDKEKQVTAKLLDLPWGRALVVAVAAVIIGFGLWQARKALSRSFTKGLDFGRLPEGLGRRAEALGVPGYLARGAVAVAVGVFLALAAIRYDPDEAVGIDGALSRLARSGPGPLLLVLVAAGLVAFGLWSMVEGWSRRSSG